MALFSTELIVGHDNLEICQALNTSDELIITEQVKKAKSSKRETIVNRLSSSLNEQINKEKWIGCS